MIAYNLSNDKEVHFDENTTKQWAVRYAFAEEKGRLNELFDLEYKACYGEIEKRFPIYWGKRGTVLCEDWAAK